MPVDRLKTGDALDDAALDALAAVDRGEVTLTLVAPHDVEPEFAASNGWRFRVFNDCGDWDYLAAYRPPEGEWREALYIDRGDDGWAGSMAWRPQSADRGRQWHWKRAASDFVSQWI